MKASIGLYCNTVIKKDNKFYKTLTVDLYSKFTLFKKLKNSKYVILMPSYLDYSKINDTLNDILATMLYNYKNRNMLRLLILLIYSY